MEELRDRYKGYWGYKDWDENFNTPLEKAVEHFYTVIIPIASEIPLPEDIEDLYVDQAMVREVWNLKTPRNFFAAYTQYGIRRIDSYFCDRIRNLKSYEEALEVEEQLIYCPHLHIKIKENLAENLSNIMKGF